MKLSSLSHLVGLLALAAGVTSCKSANRSNLESVWFKGSGKAYFVHVESDTFLINTCASTAEIERVLGQDNDGQTAKKLCAESVTAVTPMALTRALTEAILGSASDELIGTKIERINDLDKMVQDIQASLAFIEDSLKNGDFIGEEERWKAEYAKGENEIASIKSEMSKLKAAKNDPAKLKEIDINSTLALQSKIADTVFDQAALFTAMLRDTKIYTLDAKRDSFLIGVLTSFPASCGSRSPVGKGLKKKVGIEEITYDCEAGGNPRIISTTCALPGYERTANYCVFTGNKLPMNSLVTTENGVCASTSGSALTCWGKPGAFPMTSDAFSKNSMDGLTSKIMADKLVATSTSICTLSAAGSVTRCSLEIGDKPSQSISFSQIVGGRGHYCGINAGKVQCWGENALNQLDVPANLGNIKSLSTMENATCAVDEANQLSCWGKFFNATDKFDAVAPSGIKALSVSVGTHHACAIQTDNSVRCWGDNDANQVAEPRDLGSVRLVAAGRYETCAVTAAGILRCWGSAKTNYQTGPTLTNVQSLITSRMGNNFCAIHGDDRRVKCWGSSFYANPYEISPSHSSFLGLDASLVNVQDVSITAAGYACATLANGSVKCWGNIEDASQSVPNALTVTK